MGACKFDGCDKPLRYQGLCNAHYYQLKRGKELKPLQVQHHGFTEVKRFLLRVEMRGENDCWNWTGSAHAKGWHGQWRNSSGQIELTHRAAWRLFKGEVPLEMFVLHKCDNPICVNPNHLFLGTQSDNAKDMWQKGRARPGNLKGEKHGMSKLTTERVLEIRASKESGVELSRRLGLTATTICDVRKRRTWKHVT